MYLQDFEIVFQRTKHNWIALAVFFVSLIYYLSLLHINIAHAHDAPTYYNNIITAHVSWHAHHVFYEPLSFLWAEYSKLIFPEIHPFKLISSMNSFFGAGCVSLIYLILAKRLAFSVLKSLICCVAIGTSFYYLNYATTIEVYHSALFFMLATFYYALKNTPINVTDAMIIGILHGIAMSFHQMHILLGVALLPRLLKAGYWQFFIYVLYGTMIVFFTYLLACYAEHIHSFDMFKKYFVGYMQNDKIIQGSSSPFLAPFGLGIALLGGRFIISIEPFKSFLQHNFYGHELERIFYLHHKTNLFLECLQIILYCIFIFYFIIILGKYIKKIQFKDIKNNLEIYLIIFIYSLFFTFWYPHNPEFWGVSLTFIIIAIFTKINALKILGITATVIFMINLLGSGLPLLDFDNNLYKNGIDSLF